MGKTNRSTGRDKTPRKPDHKQERRDNQAFAKWVKDHQGLWGDVDDRVDQDETPELPADWSDTSKDDAACDDDGVPQVGFLACGPMTPPRGCSTPTVGVWLISPERLVWLVAQRCMVTAARPPSPIGPPKRKADYDTDDGASEWAGASSDSDGGLEWW